MPRRSKTKSKKSRSVHGPRLLKVHAKASHKPRDFDISWVGGGTAFSRTVDPYLDEQDRRLDGIQAVVEEQERRLLDRASVQEHTLLLMRSRLTNIADSLVGRRTSSSQRLGETLIRVHEILAQVTRIIGEAKKRKTTPRFSPYGRRPDKDRDGRRDRDAQRDRDLSRRVQEIRSFRPAGP